MQNGHLGMSAISSALTSDACEFLTFAFLSDGHLQRIDFACIQNCLTSILYRETKCSSFLKLKQDESVAKANQYVGGTK
jgi:hypothetical protein